MRTQSILAFGVLASAAATAQSPCSVSTKILPEIANTRNFGEALDTDGNRIAVGAPTGGPSPGRAFVFEEGPAGWVQIAAFQSQGPDATTDFGEAIAIDGDLLAVGSPDELVAGSPVGTVYVYRDVGGFAFEEQLTASDGSPSDGFGHSLALDGSRLVIGAPFDSTLQGIATGSVYVFQKTPGGWQQGPKLLGSDVTPLAHFGSAVALEGHRLLIGAPDNHLGNLFDAGSVYVYEFDGTQWDETQKLLAPVVGADDEFGGAIALNGDLFAVTGRLALPGGDQAGAHLYRYGGGSWQFDQSLVGLGNSNFTRMVDVSADRVIIGATGIAVLPMYRLLNGNWELEQTFSTGLIDDFGRPVRIDGDRVTIGAHLDDQLGFNVGAVYVEDLVAAPKRYCTAKLTSNGCVPIIDSAGAASASGSTPFPVTAREIPNQKPGLLFYGRSGATALPFLGGTLCVLPPLVRTDVQTSSGNPPPSDCSGSYLLDFSALAPGDPNLVPGSSVHAQYWFRDPTHPDGSGAGLSDALAFELCE